MIITFHLTEFITGQVAGQILKADVSTQTRIGVRVRFNKGLRAVITRGKMLQIMNGCLDTASPEARQRSSYTIETK